jgi:endoglucanase
VLPDCRANRVLAGVLIVCAVMSIASAGASTPAFAQELPDVYPAAVPRTPPPPRFGPVPDLRGVRGQDRTPRRAKGCAGAARPRGVPGIDPRGLDPGSPNPLRGLRWYVDPLEPGFRSYRTLWAQRKSHRAELMWRVAREPRFRWFGRWDNPVRRRVRNYLRCAAAVQPGAVPLMVVMRHQGKGCGGGYTGGGAAEDRRSRVWYRNFARAVGGTRVVIGFEPDSLGTVDCLTPSRRRARLNLLRYGVDVLARLPRATIYLEAGASDWEPARRTAKQLRYIGISKVRGFMLNATHHDWTRANVRHGLAISRRVGGKHFIVNTSFNGRGPIHLYRGKRRLNIWCNPPGRGLGVEPTTITGHPLVDAYMWINRPGYSAGGCNGGPMPVGSWWPERALMYARFQTSWLSPPRGTRNGFFVRR